MIQKKRCDLLIIFSFVFVLIMLSFVSASVGMKWSQESVLVKEGEKVCISYGIYNPWDTDSFITLEASGDLANILVVSEKETKLIPKNTPSSQTIPTEFCFSVPDVYEKDCLLGDFICKQNCAEDMKIFSGQISVKQVPPTFSDSNAGSGGSIANLDMAVPLNIKVECVQKSRDYSIVYITIAILSLVAIIILLIKKRKHKSAFKKSSNKKKASLKKRK